MATGIEIPDGKVSFGPFGGGTPFTNVVPFTERDGTNYNRTLMQLIAFINGLIEQLNAVNSALYAGVIAELTALRAETEAKLAAQDAQVAADIAGLKDYVDAAVERIENASIELNDTIFAGLLDDPDSDSAQRMNTIYRRIDVALTAEDVNATVQPTPNTLPLRNGSGQLPGIVAPTAVTHAANRGYVLDTVRTRSATPEEYGAVGDGVVNDTAAIQAALDAVSSAILGGGTVLFRAGAKYKLDGPAIIPTGVTVEGNGATLFKGNTAVSDVVFSNKMYTKGYGGGGRDITIRNVRVLGDYAGATRDTTSPFMHVQNLTVENVTFEQGMRNGHYLDILGCENVRIFGCTFRGMSPQTGREYIEAVQIDSATRSGSGGAHFGTGYYDGLPTRNIRVESCSFETVTVGGTEYPMPNPLGTHGGALVGDEGYYSDIWFVNNKVRGWTPGVSASYWQGWIHIPGAKNVHILGNSFAYTGPKRTAADRGSIIVSRTLGEAIPASEVENANPTQVVLTNPRSAINWKIADNTFTGFADNYTDGLSAIILINSAATDRISITGNIVDSASCGLARIENDRNLVIANNSAETIADSAGLNLVNCSGTITGNKFKGATQSVGIQALGGQFLLVQSNIIYGFIHGIRYMGMDNGIIAGNMVFDYTTYGIMIGSDGDAGSCFDITVSGNRMASTKGTISGALRFGTKAIRTFAFGNRMRDGGPVNDTGVNTILNTALNVD